MEEEKGEGRGEGRDSNFDEKVEDARVERGLLEVAELREEAALPVTMARRKAADILITADFFLNQRSILILLEVFCCLCCCAES